MTAARRGEVISLRRVGGVCVALLLLLILGVGAWLGVRGIQAKSHVDDMTSAIARAEPALATGDIGSVEDVVSTVNTDAADASELLGDPLWRALESAPFVGADVTAVRTVLSNVVDLTGAARPVLAALENPGVGLPGASAMLQRAASPLRDFSHAVETADEEIGALAPTRFGAVTGALDRFRSAVDEGSPALAQAADLAGILPGMLGSASPRHILVALQNPAEARTGGGIMGSFLMFAASSGEMTLIDQTDSSQFRTGAAIGLPAIPDGLTTLWGPALSSHVQNASMTADFALTAHLVQAWWRTRSDISPDVVISIDPLVLERMLAITGPLDIDGVGTVDAQNFITDLLLAPYALDPRDQTRVQKQITEVAITEILHANLGTVESLSVLSAAAAEGRVSVWSAHDDEQSIIDITPLAGLSARHVAAGSGSFLVALNDRTGGKMDNFLQTKIGFGSVTCRADGRAEAVVRVSLHNDARTEDLSGFSIWVTGGGQYGIKEGDIGTEVSVSAPPGWFYGGVTREGEPVVSADADDAGFPTTVAAAVAGPGEETTLEFRFVAPEVSAIDMSVMTSPLLNPAVLTAIDAPCR